MPGSGRAARGAAMARQLDRVGVVGLGTMGAGIAEVLARGGLDVVAVEPDEAGLARGRGHLERSTARAVSRGRLPEAERQALLGRVRFVRDLSELADRDLVVEAVPERLDLKRDLMARLDAVVRPDAVLGTNTSSLSVTEIAAATRRPGRVVGMHFFNPAPVLRLVEVVRTVVSENSVVDDVTALARRLGKTPVVVADRAGFVANALLFGYLNRAVAMVETGHASREDVDAAMVRGCGLPMGPLALLDLIGLDTAQEILETMYRQGGDRLHVPRPLLRQLVTAGRLGRKTGHGFYPYVEPGSGQVVPGAGTAGRQVGSHERVRTLRQVGVVGPGPVADGLAAELVAAGLDVVVGTADGLDDLGDADLVVETVADDAAAKRAVFTALDEVCRPGVVLATTTSTVPVVECAAATSRPRDVVGLHLSGGGSSGASRPDGSGGGLVEVVPAVG